jgi:hypothetical protein
LWTASAEVAESIGSRAPDASQLTSHAAQIMTLLNSPLPRADNPPATARSPARSS